MSTQWLKNLSHKAAHIKMLQPVYGMSLGKLDQPLEFQSTPADLFGGDAGRGRWMANGQIDINGHRIQLDMDKWFIGTDYQNTPFFEKLHGFDFMVELKSLGGDIGRKTARDITQNWLNHFQNYNHIIWRPDLAATRLVTWLIAYDFAYEAASDEFIDQFHACLYKHYHHLKNTLATNQTIDDFDRYSILWALIIAQCHCVQFYDEVDFQSHLQLIKGVLNDISHKDGGLIERNPQNLLDLAQSLLQLRQSLQQSKNPVPLWLSKKIETSVRTLNIYTHNDKDLPHFQGCTLPNQKQIEKVTLLSRLRFRRNDTQLENSGYTSIRKGRTSVIIDHGNKGDHVSPMAFEMGYSNHRIIVNCGTYFLDPEWSKSLSGIAAHNCLMVDKAEPKQGLLNIKSSLENLNGASLFSASHEGYSKDFGLTHTRRLYLDSDGEDFRGEDLLVRNIAIQPLDYLIRFHLHPSVKASALSDKKSILIRLPNGIGWVFKINHGELSLEDSIHCPDGVTIKKTQQIIIRSSLDDVNTTTKWAFKKQ